MTADDGDVAQALRDYRAAVRRYETDPDYRAHIARLIAETDAELDEEQQDERALARWETDGGPGEASDG